ncbi:MAG: L-histidine N(alpha)-methyltransferase [Rhodocyclaceae bacterium]|nr:MAG: L-histidine N(alpha)-methyltransferase [Rhodocyclaceae bacterium]
MLNPVYKAHHSPCPTARSPFETDLIACLEGAIHQISPKYFYDDEGSRLFDQICGLPEYYVTRTEIGILERDIAAMAACMGADAEVVEFGAGSLQKAKLLIDALEQPRRFVAVDISGEHLHRAASQLRNRFPGVDIVPLVEDFTGIDTLSLPPLLQDSGRRVGFFPGSTLGNFTPIEARSFLKSAARLLAGGGLLIGVDLVKDPRRLHAAYNDAAGVTAAFNRNLLARANRELDAGFNLDAFEHYAFYHPVLQRMEMHLICLEPQHVCVGGREFVLQAGESIHTENSHKYTVEGFQALAKDCGFLPKAVWLDPDRLFSVHWLASPRTHGKGEVQ